MSFAKAKRFEERPVDVVPSPADFYIAKRLDRGVKIPRTGRGSKGNEDADSSFCSRMNRSGRSSLSISRSSLSKSESNSESPFRRCCSTRQSRSKSSDFSRGNLRFSLRQQPNSSFGTPEKAHGNATKNDTPFQRSCCANKPKSTEKVCERFKRNCNRETPVKKSVESHFTRESLARTSMRKSGRRSNTSTSKPERNEGFDDISFHIEEHYIDDDYDSFIEKSELDDLNQRSSYEFEEMIKEIRQLHGDIVSDGNDHQTHTEEYYDEYEHDGNDLLMDETIKETDMTIVPVDYFETSSPSPKKGAVMKIIRSAVQKLKKEFKEEIYKKTERKLDELSHKFSDLRMRSEADIDEKCDNTISSIAGKLDKIVGKQKLAIVGSYKNMRRRSKRFGRNGDQ